MHKVIRKYSSLLGQHWIVKPEHGQSIKHPVAFEPYYWPASDRRAWVEVRPASLSPGLSPRGRRAESRVRPTSHRSAACRPPQGTHPGNQKLNKEDVHIWCNLGEEKIEFALGNKEFCFWQGKKADDIVILFLTSGRYCKIQTSYIFCRDKFLTIIKGFIFWVVPLDSHQPHSPSGRTTFCCILASISFASAPLMVAKSRLKDGQKPLCFRQVQVTRISVHCHLSITLRPLADSQLFPWVKKGWANFKMD